jgi:F-type H+-transporting ATPase subunit delta
MSGIVAIRYAKALFDQAKEQNILEKIHTDIQLLHDTVKMHSELRAVLANPIIPGKNKHAIIKQLFTDKVDNLTINFLDFVIDKSRANQLYEMYHQFFKLYQEERNIVKAEVVSSVALSEENQKNLHSILEKQLNKTVILILKTDPELIGGFVVRVGDRQVDASLARKLQDVKKNILTEEQ